MSDLKTNAAWVRQTAAALGLDRDVPWAFKNARISATVAARVFAEFQEKVAAGQRPPRDPFWLVAFAIGLTAARAWIDTLPRYRGFELTKRAGGVKAARRWLRTQAAPSSSEGASGTSIRKGVQIGTPSRGQPASVDARWAEVVEQINRENSAAGSSVTKVIG